MSETRGAAAELDAQLTIWDAGLVDSEGNEIKAGWVALVGPEVTTDDCLDTARYIEEFVAANPATENQGYAVGYIDPGQGIRIQRVEIRATWDEVFDATQPGDQIWDMSEDGGKVVKRK